MKKKKKQDDNAQHRIKAVSVSWFITLMQTQVFLKKTLVGLES